MARHSISSKKVQEASDQYNFDRIYKRFGCLSETTEVTDTESTISDGFSCQARLNFGNPRTRRPKKFMQLPEPRQDDSWERQQERAQRKIAERARIMRQRHEERTIQLKKRQISHFEKLPDEMIVHIMRHTDFNDVENLAVTGPVANNVYRGNRTACIKGMEVEQFPQLKWLFGTSTHRTPKQKQSLKDWIATSQEDDAEEESIIRHMEMVNNNRLGGLLLLKHLQKMQDRVDDDIESIADYIKTEMTRRTALCMVALTMSRPEVVDNTSGVAIVIQSGVANRAQSKYPYRVDVPPMPMGDRTHIYDRQPATTKAQVTMILEKVVFNIAKTLMQGPTARWIIIYHNTTANNTKMSVTAMRTWIAKLAVGFVIKRVLGVWGDDLWDLEKHVSYDEAEDMDWSSLLMLELQAHGPAEQYCSEGTEFAEHIGFHFKDVLLGTEVERLFDRLLIAEE